MSQPIRVEGWAYMPGARVSLRLRFRSQSTYARVKAEFHNPSGGVIKLEGVTQGRNPGRLTPKSSLQVTFPRTLPSALTNADPWGGLADERRWGPIFEDPAFNIRVVQPPFHTQSGGEFLGLEPA